MEREQNSGGTKRERERERERAIASSIGTKFRKVDINKRMDNSKRHDVDKDHRRRF
jgi:hypothetical protein